MTRVKSRGSAWSAALTAWFLLGCMNFGASDSSSKGCTLGEPIHPALYAQLSVSGGDFGAVKVGATATATIGITNSGNTATTALTVGAPEAPFAYAGGAYPGTGGTCGSSIAAFGKCELVVEFSPTATSINDRTLQIRYSPPPYENMIEGSAYLSLRGRGRPAEYAELLATESVDFGPVAVGSSVTDNVTVSNRGNAAANLLPDALVPPLAYAGGSFPGSGGTCASSLSPQEDCTVAVTFTPTSGGYFNAAMQLRYTPPPYTQMAEGYVVTSLRGVGTNVVLSPESYDFGSIPAASSASTELTLTNSSRSTMTVACASLYLNYPFSLTGGTCCPSTVAGAPIALEPGKRCALIVKFAPGATGSYSTTVGYGQCDSIGCWTSNVALITGSAP